MIQQAVLFCTEEAYATPTSENLVGFLGHKINSVGCIAYHSFGQM